MDASAASNTPREWKGVSVLAAKVPVGVSAASNTPPWDGALSKYWHEAGSAYNGFGWAGDKILFEPCEIICLSFCGLLRVH